MPSSFGATVTVLATQTSSEHPRVVVLHDHKPAAGATIEVYRASDNSGQPFLHVKTGDTGLAVLPRLRPGEYSLHAAVGPGYEGYLYLKVVRGARDRRQPFPIDTYCCIRDSPPWYETRFNAAKDAPVEAKMQHFQLRIMDPTGAAIPDTEVGIGQIGVAGVTKVAVLHSDKDGRVEATLPEGEYLAILSASGFEDRVLHFVISSNGDPAEKTITLSIGATT